MRQRARTVGGGPLSRLGWARRHARATQHKRILAVVPVVVVLWAFQFVSGQLQPPRTPAMVWSEDLDRAKKAYIQKNSRDSREALRRMHRHFPMASHVLHDLAMATARAGEKHAARSFLRQYVGLGLIPDLDGPAFAELHHDGRLEELTNSIRKNASSVSRASLVFGIPDPDLLVEDIAYFPESNTFFLSSVHQNKILRCTSTGGCQDFLNPAERKRLGLWSVLALRVDPRRRLLWATTVGLNAGANFQPSDKGRSALLKLDIPSRRLIARYELADDQKHAFGDMTLSEEGDVYLSDSESGAIYVVCHDCDSLETLLPKGTFVSPQTPALGPDGKSLFIADYAMGIYRVHLLDRTVEPLRCKVPVALDGIDGLYYWKGSLIAIQNGTHPERIVRLYLNDGLSVDRWQVLEANSAGLSDPTHAVIVRDSFYFIANSGWDRMAENGVLAPGGSAEIKRIILE